MYIPYGITQIGESAFEDCERINSVVISDTVTYILSLVTVK